jgi:hypothetical protein
VGRVTITIGDNWEVNTQRLSEDDLAIRKTETLRSAAEKMNISDIECSIGCHAALLAAFKAGQNRFEALEHYRNCISACHGDGPE